jgi:hypothetical protein
MNNAKSNLDEHYRHCENLGTLALINLGVAVTNFPVCCYNPILCESTRSFTWTLLGTSFISTLAYDKCIQDVRDRFSSLPNQDSS